MIHDLYVIVIVFAQRVTIKFFYTWKRQTLEIQCRVVAQFGDKRVILYNKFKKGRKGVENMSHQNHRRIGITLQYMERCFVVCLFPQTSRVGSSYLSLKTTQAPYTTRMASA